MKKASQHYKKSLQEQILDEYMSLWWSLTDLMDKGMGNSNRADNVREKMDPLWYSMNEETMDKVDKQGDGYG